MAGIESLADKVERIAGIQMLVVVILKSHTVDHVIPRLCDHVHRGSTSHSFLGFKAIRCEPEKGMAGAASVDVITKSAPAIPFSGSKLFVVIFTSWMASIGGTYSVPPPGFQRKMTTNSFEPEKG